MKRAVVALALFASVPSYAAEICGVNVDHPTSTTHALEGIWTGMWSNVLCSALVVSAVSGNDVTATYIYGAYQPWQIHEAGLTNVRGKLDGKELTFALGRAQVSYILSGDTLQGTYVNNQRGRFFKGEFKKDASR